MSFKEKLKNGIDSALEGVKRAFRQKGDPTETGEVLVNVSEEKISEAEKSGILSEGLTWEEVAEEMADGNINRTSDKHGKSYFKIILDNLFTFFNCVWAVIAVVLVWVGSYDNLTFLAVVIPNLLLATVQEIRAKRAVRKLSVTTDPKAEVIRSGALTHVDASELVLGDVMRVELGRQVLCDAIVIDGLCEANESMLTGEAEPIKKQKGDRIYAGSFIVSGAVYARIDRVGKDNYIHKIEKEAKSFKPPVSNLFRDLNRLIKTISAFMIPLTAMMFLSNWIYCKYEDGLVGMELIRTVVEKTCGSVVGMIPAGIYLLVTLTLSLSVMTLARRKVQVQDMYSIEMLASADVLCLDKTGTITDGSMQVAETVSLDGTADEEIVDIIAHLEAAENGVNPTSRALSMKFGRRPGNVISHTPFSSSRKYYAADIEETGNYALGAPHFVPCPVSDDIERKIKAFADEGKRVLILARLNKSSDKGVPVALVAIEDRIRPSAKETIEGFQNQGVTVKVISGDHAATVSTIAKKVGIINYDKYVSCENLSDEELVSAAEDFAIFGRVTPEQKVLLIKTLKKKGHTVAMTGDGVNDTLALKEANCAIAMADGSEMARAISQIVLMNSDFAALPGVVKEGRRCINNVRQSAVLYLMKTIFTILVTIFSVVSVALYPFAPNNFLFLELFVIGVASVLLALEPNEKRIEGSFLDTVMIKSFPAALSMFLPTLAILLIGRFTTGVSTECRNSVAMCVVTLVGFLNLIYICRPFTKWRGAVIGLVGTLLAVTVGVSSIIEAFLVSEGIFGFAHAVDNKDFFIWMMILGASLAFVLQFFRAQLESWVSVVGAKNKQNEEKSKQFFAKLFKRNKK